MKKVISLLLLSITVWCGAQPAGWLYNMPIQVQNSNTVNAVDYQLRITVNTQSLIGNGQMQSNGADIRFSGACTSNSFYNYWIEAGLNTPTTAIWVKIPLIAANTSSTVFMFYGNSTVTPMSAVQGTFRGPNSATDSVSGGTSGGLLVCQRGFRFVPTQNLLVTHFGKREPSGTLRYVTLFNYSTQAILSQTQVAGPANTYSYGAIQNPLWLNAGTQYVLQIFGTATDGYYYQTSSQIGQHLTYVDMQYSNGGTQNTFPNLTLANYHYGYGDFWYYIASTLAITPTYTLNASSTAITSPVNAICSGGTTTLSTNATGTFSWSTGSNATSIVVSPGTTTTYSVAQTSLSGCTSNAYFTLNVSGSPPVLSVSSSTNQTCLGKTATLTASGALTYTWSNNVTNGVSFTPSVTTTYTVLGQNGCGTTSAVTTITISPLPVSLIASPTLVCAGQPAVLSSAAAATSYTWYPSGFSNTSGSLAINPTTSTVYSLAVSDGTCAGSATVMVSADPIPTISAAASATMVCQGDPVNLSASGALTYTWTPGNLTGANVIVNPQAPTSYSVGGTNSFGCSAGAAVVVITNPAPAVTISADYIFICKGDPVNLSTGGASTYTWSTGSNATLVPVNPASTAVYSVTGTDNGCSSTQTIEIQVFDPVVTVTGPPSICSGASATLVATGANSYTWSNGTQFPSITVNPLSTTIYTVSSLSTSNSINCPASTTIQVTVNASPTIAAVASRSTICRNETVTIAATGGQSYVWNNAATSASISATSSLVTVLLFTVTGTSPQGCSSMATTQVQVQACNALTEWGAENGLRIYPNPNYGSFVISGAGNTELLLLNQLGQVVRKLHAGNDAEVTVSGLAKGIYFVTGKINNRDVNYKVVVE